MKDILATALVLALLAGCSSNKSTNPDPNTPETPIATATIGPSGGSIETPEFKLTVPAGAFTDSLVIELYNVSGDQPADSSEVSKLFRLHGLPGSFAQPLRLRMKYSGALEGASYVALGKKQYDLDHPDSVIEFTYYAAQDSSDYLVANIPAPPLGAAGGSHAGLQTAADGNADDSYARARSKMKNEFSAHFYAMIQKPFWEIPLLEHLEDCYARFTKLGFTYPPDEIPMFDEGYINVYISPVSYFDHDDPGEGSGWIFANHYVPNLKFNPEWIWGMDQPEAPEIGPYVSRVFCEMTAEMYDHDHDSLTHWWLLEAVSLWSEGLFPTHSNYVPSQFKGHEMEPFKGLMTVGFDATSSRSHGLGMAALIKYFSNRWETAGDSAALSLMYQRINLKSFTLPQAVTMIDQDRDINEWWPDFFKEYVGGNVYQVLVDTFLNHRSATYAINSRGDSLARYTTSYPDMSARLYGVDLSPTGFDATSNILLSATSPVYGPGVLKVVAFKAKPGQVQFLGSGDEVMVANPLALASEGWDLLVAVVNCHFAPVNSDASVTFQVRVSGRIPISAMTMGTVRFGNINCTYMWDPDTCGSYAGGAGSIFYFNDARGSATANVFTGAFRDTVSDDYWGHYIHHWWVTITVDTTLMNASFVLNDTTFDFDTPSTICSRFVGTAVPMQTSPNGTYQFYFEGDLCSKLTWEFRQDITGYGCDKVLNSYQCTQPSAVMVELRLGY